MLAQLIESISMGQSYRSACNRVGISYEIFKLWRQQPKTKEQRELFAHLKCAKAEAEFQDLKLSREHAGQTKDLKVAAQACQFRLTNIHWLRRLAVQRQQERELTAADISAAIQLHREGLVSGNGDSNGSS
jgi:hypothetical protein